VLRGEGGRVGGCWRHVGSEAVISAPYRDCMSPSQRQGQRVNKSTNATDVSARGQQGHSRLMVWHSCLPIVAKRRVIPAADNALRTSFRQEETRPSRIDWSHELIPLQCTGKRKTHLLPIYVIIEIGDGSKVSHFHLFSQLQPRYCCTATSCAWI
jgi:hypothetical protein